MPQQEELIQKLCHRIQILVTEVESLTGIIDQQQNQYENLLEKYQELYEKYQKKEYELSETQSKLNQAFKHNIKDHLQQINEDRQHIINLLNEKREQPQSQNQGLYNLCQQKSIEVQELRQRLEQYEQQNAMLLSENTRIRTYIQHEKMFRQLEQFNQTSYKEIPQHINIDQFYNPIHIQEYINNRSD